MTVAEVMVGDKVMLRSPRGLRRFAGVIKGLDVELVGRREEALARIEGQLNGRTRTLVFECFDSREMMWMAKNHRLASVWGYLRMTMEE